MSVGEGNRVGKRLVGTRDMAILRLRKAYGQLKRWYTGDGKITMEITEDFRKAKRNFLIACVASVFFALGQFRLRAEPLATATPEQVPQMQVPLLGAVASPAPWVVETMLILFVGFVWLRFEFECARQVRQNSEAGLAKGARLAKSAAILNAEDLASDLHAHLNSFRDSINSNIEDLEKQSRPESRSVVMSPIEYNRLRAICKEAASLQTYWQELAPDSPQKEQFLDKFLRNVGRNKEEFGKILESLDEKSEQWEGMLNDIFNRQSWTDITIFNLSNKLDQIVREYSEVSWQVATIDVNMWRFHDVWIPRLAGAVAVGLLAVETWMQLT